MIDRLLLSFRSSLFTRIETTIAGEGGESQSAHHTENMEFPGPS